MSAAKRKPRQKGTANRDAMRQAKLKLKTDLRITGPTFESTREQSERGSNQADTSETFFAWMGLHSKEEWAWRVRAWRQKLWLRC